MKPTSPVEIEGYDAYWLGVPVADCPYNERGNRGNWIAWRAGWSKGHAFAADVQWETAGS
jgi:ribosome modulation factor